MISGHWLQSNGAHLANQVINIGAESDQAYFYLGKSAQKLGYPQAARIYYRLALATDIKCGGKFFNSCDDFAFPQAVNAAMGRR